MSRPKGHPFRAQSRTGRSYLPPASARLLDGANRSDYQEASYEPRPSRPAQGGQDGGAGRPGVMAVDRLADPIPRLDLLSSGGGGGADSLVGSVSAVVQARVVIRVIGSANCRWPVVK
jgi:hypothetical protein